MMSVDAPAHENETEIRSKTSPPWKVVVLDDPVNLMNYVSLILIRIFGFSKSKAEALMMAVHEQGKAVVWTGDREKGEMYVNQLHSAQLHATLERSE